MDDLVGKVAIVTGAGNGIGRATARRLAAAGGAVVVVDLDGDAATVVAQDITGQGGEAVPLTGDVGRSVDVDRVVAATLDRYSRVDILHNNAAWYPVKAAVETTKEEWDRTLRVGLTGAWLLARAVLPPMLRQGADASSTPPPSMPWSVFLITPRMRRSKPVCSV